MRSHRIGDPTESGHAGHPGGHRTGAERREHTPHQRRRGHFLKDTPDNRHEQGGAAADDQDYGSGDQRSREQTEATHRHSTSYHRTTDQRKASSQIAVASIPAPKADQSTPISTAPAPKFCSANIGSIKAKAPAPRL